MSLTNISSSGGRTYTVQGMSCGHCVASVTDEVGEIDGVQRVDVELENGRVVVHGTGFTDEDVRAAVSAAGYELAA